MKKFTIRFLRDDKGVTAIEYGLIAGLVAAAIVTAITNVTGGLTHAFGIISTALSAIT
jgi:pilus assembly protein Flp/PilA